MAKSAYKSKTEWINFIFIILTMAQTTAKVWPIPPQWQIFALAIINAGLRLITNESVTIKKNGKN